MNFCGIIAEFNPFHNGHNYIINEAKKKTGSKIICLMSGDFVQRGSPAIENKFERAKKAIKAGANTVLELPTVFAFSNAENFAFGAIKIFKALKINQIAFGIENTDLKTLQDIAKLKFENSEKFKTAFQNEIQNGINYNTALKRSIATTLDLKNPEILNKPNNILAIEYLTAILKLDAKIEPIAIQRIDNGFNSNTPSNKYLGATAIRELIKTNKTYENFIPEFAKIDNCFDESAAKKFETLAISKLRECSPQILEKCYDYNEGIEFRVKKMAENFSTLNEINEHISTQRYRLSRVQKLTLYPLFSITKEIENIAKKTKPVVKVLAIKKDDKSILTQFQKTKISLIVTNKDYENLNNSQKKIIQIDLNASNIYSLATNGKFDLDKKIGTIFM